MKKARNSRLLTIIVFVILAFWAAVIGIWLADRQNSSPLSRDPASFDYEPEFDPAASPGSRPPSPGRGPDAAVTWDHERWSGIYLGDDKIGYAVSRRARTGEGHLVMERSRIKLRVLDTEQDLFFNVQARLDDNFHLLELEQEVLSGFMTVKNHAVRKGDDIKIAVTSAGQTTSHTLRFDRPLSIDTVWLYENAARDMKPGDEKTIKVFQALLLSELPVSISLLNEETIQVGGREVPCYKGRISVGQEVQWIWIARDTGQIIKQHAPSFGFMTQVEDKDEAIEVDWAKARNQDDLLLALVVKASRPIPDPRSATYLKARLEGASLEGLDLEDPPRQALDGTVIEVRSDQALPAVGYPLPIQQSLPGRAAEFKAELEPTPYLQSNDPRIKKAAQRAVGDAADAVTAVDRLLAWTADYVRDSMVYSIPSALEVLEKRQGACKEHTILFVALTRALGVPARQVTGIVYTETMTIDGFYYHAWAEVFLADPEGEGAWVAVDPTFNQNPADATHILLKRGGVESVIDMMHLMGNLRVEVEESR